MFPKSTIPVSPVPSHALLIPQAVIHQQAQQSERRIRFLLIAAIIGAVLFAIVKPASAQVNWNLKKSKTSKAAENISSLNGKYSSAIVTLGSNSISTI